MMQLDKVIRGHLRHNFLKAWRHNWLMVWRHLIEAAPVGSSFFVQTLMRNQVGEFMDGHYLSNVIRAHVRLFCVFHDFTPADCH